ncbi:MAG TPA: hypothetical protein VFK06_17895 [Candidatus Angelobacter sp.]|nr:hypothetical protein [Candidatus Angelobacter sp.]
MGTGDLILGIVLMVPMELLAFMLVKRKVYREFPYFVSYVICSLLISVVRLSVIRASYTLYFKCYAVTDIVYVITTLLALHESFKWEFLDFYEFKAFRFVYPAVIAAIMGPAIWYALQHPSKAPPVFTALLAVVTAVNYVTLGLVALFFLFVWCFGFEWHRYPFGIVIGFAVSSLQYWAAYGLKLEFGARVNLLLKYATPVAQLCGIAVWLGVFAKAMVLTPPEELSPSKAAEILDDAEWSIRILKDLGKSKYDF